MLCITNPPGANMARFLVLAAFGLLVPSMARAADPVDSDGDGYFVENSPTSDAEKVPAEKLDCDDSNVLAHPGAPELLGDGVDFAKGDNNCDGVDDDVAKEAYIARLTEKYPEGEARDAKAAAWEVAITNCVDADTTEEVDGAVWVIGASGSNLCQVLNDEGVRSSRYVYLWPEGELMNAPTTAGYRRNAGASARAAKAAEGAQADATQALIVLNGNADSPGLVYRVGRVEDVIYGIDVDGDGRTDGPTDRKGLLSEVTGLKAEVYYGVDLTGDGIVDRKAVLTRLDELEASDRKQNVTLYGSRGDNGLVHDVDVLQSGYNKLARNGFSLFAGGTLLGGAQPALIVPVCVDYTEAGCLEDGIADRTVRGGGIFGGGGSVGVAYNWEQWRAAASGTYLATGESGQNYDGDTVAYSGSIVRGDLTVLRALDVNSPWFVGGNVGFQHQETGSTPISSRVSGNGGSVGFATRYEIPVRGPVEMGFEGLAELTYGKYGSTITDPTGEWPALQEGVGFDLIVRYNIGLGPWKRYETSTR
jgi:hypothetical protein